MLLEHMIKNLITGLSSGCRMRDFIFFYAVYANPVAISIIYLTYTGKKRCLVQW